MEPKNFWIIGGTSGTGAATAIELRKRGHRTFITGEDTDVRSYRQLQAAHVVCCEHLAPDTECEQGWLDGVVYAAGVNYLQWLGKMESEDGGAMFCATDVMDVNVNGFIRVMDILAHGAWKETRPLKVVAISSDAATRPMRTSTAYCASKAALNMAVRCAARELGQWNWQVNAISPGMLHSTQMTDYVDRRIPLVRGWSQHQMHSYELDQEVVAGRIDPHDVAQVVCDTLFGPPHLNGSIITFNGGR